MRVVLCHLVRPTLHSRSASLPGRQGQSPGCSSESRRDVSAAWPAECPNVTACWARLPLQRLAKPCSVPRPGTSLTALMTGCPDTGPQTPSRCPLQKYQEERGRERERERGKPSMQGALLQPHRHQSLSHNGIWSSKLAGRQQNHLFLFQKGCWFV